MRKYPARLLVLTAAVLVLAILMPFSVNMAIIGSGKNKTEESTQEEKSGSVILKPPDETTATETTATETTATETTAEVTTAEETTGDETSGEETTGEETTGEETTGDETTVEETTGNETTGDETTGDETTGDETTGDDTSAVETTGDETLGEDTVVETSDDETVYNLRTLRFTPITLARGGGLITQTIPGGEYLSGDLADGEYVEVIYKDENIGFAEAVNLTDSVKIYASLPVQYGEFNIGEGETYFGISRLVDVAEYNDKLSTPMIIDMKLSHADPESLFPRPAFYSRNLCLLQYDAVKALLEAQKIFNNYGYTIKIYDAYRPTSVQQSWYNIVRVHKWVASPEYGDGGMHDRGIAVDISLVDIKTGEELDMPTAMHTFSDASARNATTWTETQTKNSNLLTAIMTSCGFTTISSEWWHFQLIDKNKYLPTDHPLDSVPLVAYK